MPVVKETSFLMYFSLNYFYIDANYISNSLNIRPFIADFAIWYDNFGPIDLWQICLCHNLTFLVFQHWSWAYTSDLYIYVVMGSKCMKCPKSPKSNGKIYIIACISKKPHELPFFSVIWQIGWPFYVQPFLVMECPKHPSNTCILSLWSTYE